MTVDLDTGQEYKQQIPKNWKAQKKKTNPRELDSSPWEYGAGAPT